MTADGLWRPHSRWRTRVYQPRYRRDCLGELVQIDGSHHDWFEGRAPKCCLLVFMDDATGRLMHLRFCDSENTFDYMMATRQYIEVGEKITVYDYPDGSIAFRHQHRPLGYKIFDKLTCVAQGAVVDNKRLGAVLRLAQQKQDELEAEGKRMRSTKMPRRRAQERALEELRAINPVLASPQDFIPSLKR